MRCDLTGRSDRTFISSKVASSTLVLTVAGGVQWQSLLMEFRQHDRSKILRPHEVRTSSPAPTSHLTWWPALQEFAQATLKSLGHFAFSPQAPWRLVFFCASSAFYLVHLVDLSSHGAYLAVSMDSTKIWESTVIEGMPWTRKAEHNFWRTHRSSQYWRHFSIMTKNSTRTNKTSGRSTSKNRIITPIRIRTRSWGTSRIPLFRISLHTCCDTRASLLIFIYAFLFIV